MEAEGKTQAAANSENVMSNMSTKVPNYYTYSYSEQNHKIQLQLSIAQKLAFINYKRQSSPH